MGLLSATVLAMGSALSSSTGVSVASSAVLAGSNALPSEALLDLGSVRNTPSALLSAEEDAVVLQVVLAPLDVATNRGVTHWLIRANLTFADQPSAPAALPALHTSLSASLVEPALSLQWTVRGVQSQFAVQFAVAHNATHSRSAAFDSSCVLALDPVFVPTAPPSASAVDGVNSSVSVVAAGAGVLHTSAITFNPVFARSGSAQALVSSDVSLLTSALVLSQPVFMNVTVTYFSTALTTPPLSSLSPAAAALLRRRYTHLFTYKVVQYAAGAPVLTATLQQLAVGAVGAVQWSVQHTASSVLIVNGGELRLRVVAPGVMPLVAWSSGAAPALTGSGKSRFCFLLFACMLASHFCDCLCAQRSMLLSAPLLSLSPHRCPLHRPPPLSLPAFCC
jgi:hypothetical protein